MNRTATTAAIPARALRRVLVLADDSADWKVAGLRQLDRLVLTLHEFMCTIDEPITICIVWSPDVPVERRWFPDDPRLSTLLVASDTADHTSDEQPFDLVVNTRLFLFRNSIPTLLATTPAAATLQPDCAHGWHSCASVAEERSSLHPEGVTADVPWRYLRSADDIPACERDFLRHAGKTQDGLVSRHVNRPISRTISRLLLKFPITPNTWSVSIFALPLCASALLLRGSDTAFLLGCVIFQLYSIVDGCDGEIARAKFMQTESGRRLDSLLDLTGNMLLALCLGVGLARQWEQSHVSGWFYLLEGVAAAAFIALSEGIVFARRSRTEPRVRATRWNGALYQRHHEFFERSGILILGERFAWWLVQLTKRDMAMLGFLLLAAFGWAEGILHLLLLVSGASSLLAGNAFLREPAPAVAQEAS